MSDLTIRPADESDVDALCDLYYEFHAIHVRGVPDRLAGISPSDSDERRKLSDRVRSVLRGNDSAILVATLSSKVIGLAEVYIREDQPVAARVQHRFGYLQSMVIAGQDRGQGAGRSLLAAAERWAQAFGATELRLDTWEFAGGPLGFYERCGYRTIRRTLVRTLE